MKLLLQSNFSYNIYYIADYFIKLFKLSTRPTPCWDRVTDDQLAKQLKKPLTHR